MKVRIATSLCTFILWSSLLAPSHHARSSNRLELKVSPEISFNALAPEKPYEAEKLTYFSPIVLVNTASGQSYWWQERLKIFHSFTHRFAKFYLLYRVLRH